VIPEDILIPKTTLLDAAFFVNSVFAAARAEFLEFQLGGCVLLILVCRIVFSLAHIALQRNKLSHVSNPCSFLF
jgi:hypothetical protein